MEPYKTFFLPFDSTKLDLLILTIQLKIEYHQVIRKKAQEKVLAPICGEITLTKESIKTKKVINGPKLITQSEATAPEVIVVEKLRTDISVNYGLTGETRASVTPEKRIPRKKRNKNHYLRRN